MSASASLDRSAAPTSQLASLSVIFPCHNERDNIAGLVDETLASVGTCTQAIELIIVDDGSTDGTPALAAALRLRDPRIRVVRHERRLGYGMALRSGIAASRSDWVFYTDGDAQFDVREFPRLMEALSRGDVAVGYRLDRKDNLVRRVNGVLWSMLVRRLFGLRVRDVDCAFKLFPRRVIEGLELTTCGAVTSTELLVGLQSRGCRIVEVGVHHRRRLHGRATGGELRVIARAFWELAALRLRLRRSRRSRSGV